MGYIPVLFNFREIRKVTICCKNAELISGTASVNIIYLFECKNVEKGA
jgi:hypothetical protein